jgi:hypothetical protein
LIFWKQAPLVDVSGWFSSSSNQLGRRLKIDSQISKLVQAMATYSVNNPCFDPTSSTVQTVPNDSNLRLRLQRLGTVRDKETDMAFFKASKVSSFWQRLFGSGKITVVGNREPM